MKKKEVLLIALVILVSAALLGASFLMNAGKTATGTVEVYVDGALYTTAPLEEGKTLTITQEDGSKNVIRMMADGFYMEEASCPDQRCVQQGKVTQSNWYLRSLGVQVICLPNRVTVELKLADQQQMDQHIDAPDV